MTTAATKTRLKFVGRHLDDLADGRVLEPGEIYTLTAAELADPHNQLRIESGLLIEAPAHTAKKGE
jgi:hypothetical protein